MKIGFISDTHDHKEAIQSAFSYFEKEGIRNVIHLGDLISPFNFRFIREVYTGNLYYVFGNNDGERLFLVEQAKEFQVATFKLPQVIDINGIKIIIMHEPFVVKELAETQKFKIVAYGHTHKLHIEKVGETHIINPGEACGYLTGKRTFVVFDAERDICEVREF
uniref:Phosphoesterase n=1 Tax=candidate division WOR-3 bacterium TaxID=2052148 RepID=A0A7V3KML7_UNCW3